MVSWMDSPGPLRAVRSWEEAVPDRSGDRAAHEAILETVGERGYGEATVREMAERAGIGESRFRQRFGDKQRCFAAAYAGAADELRDELLGACAEADGWRAGFEAALSALLRFVAARPAVARSLLIEAKAARGEAWARHQQAVERLIEAVDSAREQPGARANASSVTAGFVVGAIEETLSIELAAGRGADVRRLHDDLTRLAFLQLFGEELGA